MRLSESVAHLLSLLGRYAYARDAVLLASLNVAAKLVMFGANVYAARCLGAYNLGISAQIMAYGQQAALGFNGGFDTIAVKQMVANRKRVASLTRSILICRISIAALILLIWIAAASVLVEDASLRMAWYLGGLLIFVGSLNISFVFQALGKLPIQAAATLLSALLWLGLVAAFFHPRMPLGADLVVSLIATAVPLFLLLLAYFLLRPKSDTQVSTIRPVVVDIASLVRTSWSYWVLATLTFMYSGVQVPIVAYYLGDTSAGVYRSAYLFMSGIYLIFHSVNSLLLPKLVEWHRLGPEAMWAKQIKLAYVQGGVCLPVIVAVAGLAPYAYSIFLGPEFDEGVLAFQILSAQILVTFVGQIFLWGLAASDRHGEILRASILGVASCFLLNPFAAPSLGVVGVAIVSLISEIIIHGYCFLIARSRVKRAA